MPPKKVAERNLPAIKNEIMLKEIDPAVLSTKCRVQDVRFGAPDQEGTTETFVRIKTQNPTTTVPHFIMRKAKDDYISATSMFRAVYHKASEAQMKNEMEIVRRELAARSDDNASGVWVPGTPDALQLADIYGIRPWVQALLDAPTSKAEYGDESRPGSSGSRLTPPPSSLPTDSASPKTNHSTTHKSEQLVAATPSRKSGRERSTSPRKIVPASARKLKKAALETLDTVGEHTQEVAEDVKGVVPDIKAKADDVADAVQKPISSTTAKVPKSVSKAASLTKKAASSAAKAVKAAAENGIEEAEEGGNLFTTSVASVGQSMSDMMAEARAQVEAAEHKDAEALAESGLAPPQKRKSSKRQAKEAALEDDDDEDGALKEQAISVKRSKVEDLEIGLVQEKRKVRALFGLVIGLGATAILPYLL